MRFWSIILFGGALVGLLMPQMPGYRVLSAMPWLQVALLFVVPFAVGIAVQQRAALAAVSAFVIGVAVWIVVWLRPSPPWAPSDNWSLETWVQFLFANVLPGVVLFAALGALGGWLRSRGATARELGARLW